MATEPDDLPNAGLAVPEPAPLAPDLYDTTARWQALFGLDGMLSISEARRDARAPRADGPALSTFRAAPAKAGWYTFVFVRIDYLGQPYQLHAVRLSVTDDAKNSKPPVVSPVSQYPQMLPRVAPGEPVIVQWSYNPGGEGLAGGWRLSDVAYSPNDAQINRPGIPGYDYRGGE